MIRIAITLAAYDAVCATMPLGSVAVEPEASERGERLIWLEAAMADRLCAIARTGRDLQQGHFAWSWRRRRLPSGAGEAKLPIGAG